jgi:hypothetical protein
MISRLETHPPLDEIEEFRESKSDTIYIKSPIMQGATKLHIGSAWHVDYSDKSIHLLSLDLISPYEKTPLIPFATPDRHLRAARKIGAALFDVKRFDRLFLIRENDSSTGYEVDQDDVFLLFMERTDAELYTFTKGEESEIIAQPLTKKNIFMAQRNSANIRTKVLRMMTKLLIGQDALKQLKTLKQRGIDPRELEKIWCDTHDQDDIPAALRSLLYE